MTKIIKFRAWDKDEKKFGYYELKNGVVWWLSNFDSIDKNREEDQQYTGLKDKNRKEIYEGDIVKSDWYEDEQRITNAPICFSSGRFTCMGLRYDLYKMPELEVIGNIYENPELLTK